MGVVVAGTDLRLTEGSAGARPSTRPCSIKRCQFPSRISLRIHHNRLDTEAKLIRRPYRPLLPGVRYLVCGDLLADFSVMPMRL